MTTRIPNSMLESPAGGSGTPVPVTPTTYVIRLNTTGSGISYTDAKVVDANVTLDVEAGSVTYGNAWAHYIGDGAGHTLGYGPFKEQNGYVFNSGAGQQNCFTFVKDPGGNFLAFGYAGDPVGTTIPTLLSAVVSDTDPRKVHLTWSRAVNPSVSAAAAFAISSAHAIVGHDFVDTSHTDLILATAFIGTESAKTLAYTQPASNKMQDLSGNLVVNFSGVAITNNVVNPILLSLVVANGTPGFLDGTWSKAIDPTISAYTNFAVSSGHPLTAHSLVDPTHSRWTTSTPFVGGEAKTFAYTPSGTNDMKDLSGGNLVQLFSGFTIVDNVSTGTIFEDDFSIPLSGTIDAHAPNVANPNSLAWVDHTVGNDAFLGGSLKMGEIVGSPYAVDGAYLAVPSAIALLEFTFLCTTGATPNVSQADIYVRDTGAATAATLTGYRFRVDPELGNITVNQVTAGTVGSTLATLSSTAWASNAVSKLGLAFTVNSVQVKVNNGNVGSPVTVSGSNHGIRIAATGRGAHGIYATYTKAI